MSAIASFYLLETSKLNELKQYAEIIVKKGLFSKKITDNYWDYLAGNATALKSPDSSGYIYANILIYLQEEKGIDLLTSKYNDLEEELTKKRGASHFIFTESHKNMFLPQLTANLFPLKEIQKFNEEFSEEGDEETAGYMLDAIQLLKENLAEIKNDSQVLLLIV